MSAGEIGVGERGIGEGENVFFVSGVGGIASGEAFGAPTVSSGVAYAISAAGGIASGEVFGTPALSANGRYSVIDAGGVVSGETFGTPTLTGIFSGGSSGADATEVWQHVLEGDLTAEEMLRIILAAVSGRTEGIGTLTERYLSRDGTRPRITATFDSQSNRTSVAVDGA